MPDTLIAHDKVQPIKRRRRGKDKPWKDVVLSGIAGGVAGSVAKTGVAPLDRVKILLQTQQKEYQKYSGSLSGAFRATAQIYRETGVRGLLQGHSVTLLRIFPYAGIKFMAYDFFHNALMPTQADETSLRLYAAGSIAGITSVFFTYPLELIRVRLAFEIRHSMTERVSLSTTVSKIYTEGQSSLTPTIFQRFPILKFYRGYSVSMLGMIPYAGTSFLVFGNLQSYLRSTPLLSKPQREKYRTVLDLGCGAIAGAMSQTASYPFEVIRRRMQVGGLTHPDQWLGFRETVRNIASKNGWRGFFVGLSVGYVKIVPMTALSFTTWKAMKRWFNID